MDFNGLGTLEIYLDISQNVNMSFQSISFCWCFFCLVELYRKRLNEKQVSLSRYSIYQTKKFLRAFL